MPKRLFFRFVRWIGYDLGISPNQITLGRLLLFAPGWLCWVYRRELEAATGVPWQVYGFAALITVTVVIVFDIVDGALARETGQVSREGKVLDPIVDKFITYSTLALFWGVISQVGLGILFFLDLISTGLRGVTVEGANQFGKLKALCQNLSKLFFGLAVLLATAELNLVGNVLVWLAVLFASISVGSRVLPEKAQTSILVAIPQALTLSNLGSGIAAIVCAFTGRLELGILFNIAAMVFDLMDGAVARRLGVTSRFGSQFDTVADLVSFGCAPAFLVYHFADRQPAALVLGLGYLGATGYRLYDYGKSKGKTPTGFFRGMPSPAGAWLATTSILVAKPLGLLPLSFVAMVLSAGLMVSFRINWIHFNRVFSSLTVAEIASLLLLGLLLASFVQPWAFLVAPILVYVVSPLWRKPGAAPSTPA